MGKNSEKLFGGLSEAYAFVDLAQKAYGTRPGSIRYKARLSGLLRRRPRWLDSSSIYQTASEGRVGKRKGERLPPLLTTHASLLARKTYPRSSASLALRI